METRQPLTLGYSVLLLPAISLIALSSGCVQARRSQLPRPDIAAVEAVLTARYPSPKRVGPRKYELAGNETYYVAGWTEVRQAEVGEMSAYVRGIRLYESSLFWMHWGPEEIRVLVALRDVPLDTTMTLSPDFEAPDEKFLQVLADSYVGPVGERPSLALSVARLFATITHQGEARNPSCNEDCCSAELWKSFGSNPRPWYKFNVCFDAESARVIKAEWMPPPSAHD